VDDRVVAIGSENLSPRALTYDNPADGTVGHRGVYLVTDAVASSRGRWKSGTPISIRRITTIFIVGRSPTRNMARRRSVLHLITTLK